MRKRVLLVAHDAAPSRCFQKLKQLLEQHEYDVDAFLADGRLLNELIARQMYDDVRSAEFAIAVLGMSSSEKLSADEIRAGEVAKQHGIPFGFYGDVERCWGRARKGAWFESLAEQAAFYFGVNEKDADAAHEVFPNAVCIGTGNPLREDMAFPTHTKEEIRNYYKVLPQEKLILVPGNKFTAGNIVQLSVIIQALERLAEISPLCFHLIFALHPGDETPHELYDQVLELSSLPTEITFPTAMKTSHIVPGADLIIEFGSSIGFEGSYQRIPVLTLGTEINYRHLEKVQGSRLLETVNLGITEMFYGHDPISLADTIRNLLDQESETAKRLLRNQEMHCPIPKQRGEAVQKMCDMITTLLEK